MNKAKVNAWRDRAKEPITRMVREISDMKGLIPEAEYDVIKGAMTDALLAIDVVFDANRRAGDQGIADEEIGRLHREWKEAEHGKG